MVVALRMKDDVPKEEFSFVAELPVGNPQIKI